MEKKTRTHVVCVVIFAVFTVMGCRAPEPIKVTQIIFVPKPEISTPPNIPFQSLMNMFQNYDNKKNKGAWLHLTSARPSVFRSSLDEKPVLCTAWYEYLVSGEKETTKIDALLYGEFNNAIKRMGANDVNEALRCLNAGTLAFNTGQYVKAKTCFRQAIRWMEELTDRDTEFRAIIAEGDKKIYKGNFYERAMVHFYLGLIEYYNENYQDARLEFSRSIEADKSKPNKEMRGKFALAHYWLAKTYDKLNDSSNALLALKKCTQSEIPIEKEKLFINKNLTLVVQLGNAPRLTLKGADWETTKYEPVESPDVDCEVYIDGKKTGSIVMLSDAWTSISNSGRSSLDTLQSGKSLLKNTARLIPYAGILLVGWDVKGDARSWTSLPAKTLVWTGNIEPGYHNVTVKFYNKENYELTKYRQTWNYIPTTDKNETVLFVRSMENKCNFNFNY